ncbi:MAG: hypothetical protein JWR85_1260 [Marmoricola sp.]|nr:hypothetical protein [Marmoricola sp.]
MSDGTPPPPPSDDPYGAGAGQTPPPPPPNQPPGGQPGGYGAAAPPPPPPGPVGSGAYSAPDAFSYAWAKFKAKPGDLLVPVLLVVVVLIVLEIIVQILLRATLLGTHDCTRTIFASTIETQCGPGFFVTIFASALGGLVVSLIAQVLGAGLIKNALNVADGRPVDISEIATWATKPNVIVAALIVAGATFVGSLLFYIPGLIVAFLLNWTMFFVVDKNLAPMAAAKASIDFVASHLGETIVFYLLAIVVIVVGTILCLVGLLAAVPIVLIGAAFTFRRLQGESVSPAA